ncbi:unnamed protein product [Nesidiocoris tenuis]|uniref:Uncharacterized protein n=1 Tax=Nesidiocoris tenuis TaxID=355587 RepID=A0A6H5H3C5_9HEMI|nr:unnamed protein product [Nesidiocoris tenuis]
MPHRTVQVHIFCLLRRSNAIESAVECGLIEKKKTAIRWKLTKSPPPAGYPKILVGPGCRFRSILRWLRVREHIRFALWKWPKLNDVIDTDDVQPELKQILTLINSESSDPSAFCSTGKINGEGLFLLFNYDAIISYSVERPERFCSAGLRLGTSRLLEKIK